MMSDTEAVASAAVAAVSDIPNPFLQYLGIVSGEMRDGKATLYLDLHPHHMNSWQITHGGVTMSLLDVVMAMAARSCFDDQKGVVTLEMKTSFLQAAGVAGARLQARATVLHQTATLCFCQAEVWNQEKQVAAASGTYQFLRSTQAARSLARTSS